MTGSERIHKHKAKDAAAAHGAPVHRRAAFRWRRRWTALRRGALAVLRRRWFRRLIWGTSIAAGLAVAAVLGLWWRLSSGPIELDVATPWLKAAIEQNFGGQHQVSVGGTQIERDERGRTSLRLRDIVVRDGDGAIVASAPKAEVGISARALLTGQLRARSLNLVGAEMSIRIEADGRVTVFAGADKRPIATTAPPVVAPRAAPTADGNAVAPGPGGGFSDVTAALAWIDTVGASGLDGHDLREIGLKNGNLVVEDQRNGKRWTFDRINVSLTRPAQGGVVFKLESDNPARPWVLSAAMRPLADRVRAIGIEARKLALRDILLALRLDDGALDADLALSASIRAEMTADGTLQSAQGQISADPGTIVDHGSARLDVKVDRADFRFNWDARRRTLLVPFQIQSEGSQFTLLATCERSADADGGWTLTIARGDPVIDPVILSLPGGGEQESIGFNRVNVRARIDPARRRIDLEQGDFRRIDTRPVHNVGVALTGSLDYAGAEPRLAFGVAGTRMPLQVMMRLWPVFAATDVRSWVEEHMSGGMVERAVVAGNATLSEYKIGGPPMPTEGLSVDIETSGTSLRPVDNLPTIRDADLTVHITGSSAVINLGRGTVEVAPGRKLGIAGGTFEVPDTHLKPAPASAVFRLDGALPAAAALLSSEAFSDSVGIALDPASTRGTVAAQVTVNFAVGKDVPENSARYTVGADLTNFSADKLLLGQKVEASALHVVASKDGYQIKGDVKINGTPAAIDVVKRKGEADADLRVAALLDEAARRRFGIDLNGAVTGIIPVRVTGRFGARAKDDRVAVDADLTSVKVDNLLPGWVKLAGRPARATYMLTKTPKSVRFDDLVIEGSGTTVKGSIELDGSNGVIAAHFPVFSVSEGDKATLKAERGSDGALKVVMRGDVYDGQKFVKSSMAGAPDKGRQKQADLDLDIRLGTVLGYNGETLRGLDLKLSRRAGQIRTFAMNARIGRDAPLIGDLRLRARDHHQVVYLETDDAGALFRFTDMYPRMFGGQMWVAMDPPTQAETPQVGTLYIRNFAVRGEPALDRVVSGAPGAAPGSVDFSEMRSDFTRFPGRMAVRDGIVRGPLVGATVEGQIDYTRDDIHLRGTFVPFYGLNNMFGQIPIVGLFLGGGSNEGLLGITYEAVGPPGSPRVTVNPVSAIAPGLLRKFIPSPGTFDRNFIPPTR